ncbi:TonB-dependent receptor [Lysobacter sp. S4-A87]|uniref:TonB-dependent receptor n=1 Tax=Lysobacter sp. S4-A87 TaxID=2925843 RepID=UPI001F539633|nr:TonB-dependent receptor [Lysobacter sp. S4-A87]UNK49405.1 TonB-dependent receptor [Lysobacter sp. S4-A87]
MNRALRRSALTVALGLCFASTVQAQSNTAGAVFGQAAAGDTVLVENPATGFKRTITVGGDGQYRASALPTGNYRVTLQRADGTSTTRENVTVNVGTGTSVNFAAAPTGETTTLDSIRVTGAALVNPIDVSSVESTTILTAAQIAKIPVPRDLTSVALLAPGTVKGDAAFGNLPSFGGASVAENGYYVNGFNVTNSFKGLNFANIPFEAIAEQQIKTGGYGAEFGRSTGGVINVITKRGTNDFEAGGNIFWEPESLTETDPNLYYPSGDLVEVNSRDKGSNTTASVWASGALVKDKLFAYGLLQYGMDDRDVYPGTFDGVVGDRNYTDETKSPMWLVKLDWNINDNNLLALTAFSDKRKTESKYYHTVFGTDAAPDWTPSRGSYAGTDNFENGGTSYSLKYTGYLTDTFTLSALAGHGEFRRFNYGVSAGGISQEYTGNVGGPVAGCPWVVDARPSVVNGINQEITGCWFVDSLGRTDAKDTRDQFRIDAEWQLGDHLLRGGVDIDNFETVDGTSYAGGEQWRYGRYTPIGGTPTESVVRRRVFQSGATVKVDQRAYYIEDNWSITDTFNAYLGLRWDTFDNKNGVGDTYVKIDNQFAPRLGFSWDVNGDSSLKIFGNAGRYALPLTANVAIRGASASLYSEQFYSYTGVDPVTGAPTGLVQILNPANGEPIRYLNNEFGLGKDAKTIASSNLEPMYQDEYILGFQTQVSEGFSAGARAIYRDLKRAIDDTCDYRPVFEWAEQNGYEINDVNPGFPYCRLYNPGSDGEFTMDVDGDGTFEHITIPADVLGPKAKRTYKAVELFAEGQLTDKFFLQGSYTWSKNKGNTEGGVKSDIGQADTGTTQDFDYPELMVGADGYLPNDRRHSFKLFGNYEFNDQWSAGANLLVQSGRPINCFGYNGAGDSGYANSYFWCDKGDGRGSQPVPRGTAGRTPWTRTLDLNVAYSPSIANGELTFKVDVFNVTNEQEPVAVYEYGEDAGGTPQQGGTAPDGTAYANIYGYPTAWQAPRSVRFMVQYRF